jgi:hypothetical protein
VCSEIETKQKIVHGYVDFPENVWNSLPAGASLVTFIIVFHLRYCRNINELVARTLVKSLLRYNYETRSTIAMALQAPWIYCDLDALEQAYRDRVSLN